MVSLYYPLFAVSVLLVSITLVLFSNTLGADFVYDDTYVGCMRQQSHFVKFVVNVNLS